MRWIGITKAQNLHKQERAIFIDCRERGDYGEGGIPGAWHVPMSAVMRYGIVNVLGQDLIHALLSTKRNCLIVVYSQVRPLLPRPPARGAAPPRPRLSASHTTTFTLSARHLAAHHLAARHLESARLASSAPLNEEEPQAL